MVDIIASSEKIIVLGLGMTGLSVARYLQRENRPFILADTRSHLANQALIEREFGADLHLNVDESVLLSATTIIISPGIDRRLPMVAKAIDQGIEVIGDIELFARATSKPVLAITGSNGKTTVTTWVGELLKSAGFSVAVGGNIGTPVLDLLVDDQQWDYYVLELSSFQLESTNSLAPVAATILNVSPDHLDRYDSLIEYHMAKQRIYRNAKAVIVNREDPLTQAPVAKSMTVFSVGLGSPDRHAFGIVDSQLTYEFTPFLSVDELKVAGKHNQLNAMFALAMIQAVGIDFHQVIPALKAFSGLPHRCQTVASHAQVLYINDSKATNVGATLAALQGLSGGKGKLVLIAGGEGKQADFTPLRSAFLQSLRALVVMGKAAQELAELVAGEIAVVHVNSMIEAVKAGQSYAQPGDIVLLSPACASFDMFTSFEHRGECFVQAVRELAA